MDYDERQIAVQRVEEEMKDKYKYEFVQGNVDINTFDWVICIIDNGCRYTFRFGKDDEISMEQVENRLRQYEVQ